MSPNDDKNIIDLNAIRAHKRENNEIEFTQQTSSRSSGRTVNSSTNRRPTSNQKRNVRNSCSHSSKKYKASLNKNYVKLKKSVVAGTLAATLAIGGIFGGVVGHSIADNNKNIEYSLDEYNPSELFTSTNQLIKQVAQNELMNEKPHLKETLDGYYLESYEETYISRFSREVELQLNYINRDSKYAGGAKYVPIEVTLPKDFAKKVYLPYKDLREISQQATDEKKEKVSYWVKLNETVTELTDGLKSYIENTKDTKYVDSAKSVLDDAKSTDDDDDAR